MGNSFHWRRVERRRLEHGHVEERRPPGVRARRPDGHIADEELCLLLAAHRPADHDLHALTVDLLGLLRGRDHRGDSHHVELRIAAPHLDGGERRHVAQQRREVVALDVGNMVGLGGREQHLVDMRPEQQPGDDAAVAVAEAFEDGVERAPRILECVAAGEQRAQHVDQHDLPRIAAEVLLVEPRHRLALVDVETLRHQRAERMRREHLGALGHVEGREPEIRHVSERAATQEAARLQEAQTVPVARLDQARAIEVVRLLGDLFAGIFVRPMLADEGAEIARNLRAHTLAESGEGRARPFGVALAEQRQVEQPFAGIVDNADGKPRRAAGELAQELANGVSRREADLDPDLADVGRAFRPVGNRHLLDVGKVRKARQPQRLAAFQVGGDQPPLAHHIQQRHPVRVVQRAEQIVDQAGDEDRLAGTAQPGHCQPYGGTSAGELAQTTDQPLRCLRKARRQPAQIHHRRHAKSAVDRNWPQYPASASSCTIGPNRGASTRAPAPRELDLEKFTDFFERSHDRTNP